MLGIAPAIGWSAIVALPGSAYAALLLRKRRGRTFLARMRPHFVLGYGALATGTVHAVASVGAMAAARSVGIWIGTAALVGLGVQAFLGASLQAPGDYRRLLRRLHAITFWGVLALSGAHVVLDSPYLIGAL